MAKASIKRKSAEQYNLDANAWVKGRIRDILNTFVEKDKDKGGRTISFKSDLKRLEDRLKKRLDDEIKRIFPRIAGKLLGTPSFRSQIYYLYPKAFDDGQDLRVQGFDRAVPERFRGVQRAKAAVGGQALATWQPLRPATVERKKSNQFFLDKGELRNYLRGVDGLSKLGESRVLVSTVGFEARADNVKDIQLAKITVVLFPNLPARQRAILTAEDFRPDPKGALEYGMFTPAIREKLAGPVNESGKFRYRYRPLVPPVLRWYLAYKLPLIAASTIAGFSFRKRSGVDA